MLIGWDQLGWFISQKSQIRDKIPPFSAHLDRRITAIISLHLSIQRKKELLLGRKRKHVKEEYTYLRKKQDADHSGGTKKE